MYSEEESIVSVMHKKAKDDLVSGELDSKVDLNSTTPPIDDDEHAKESNEASSEVNQEKNVFILRMIIKKLIRSY